MDGKERKKSLKVKAAAYIILRLIVIVLLIRSIFTHNWSETFYCVLTLILFMLPSIIERHLKLELPSTLEIVLLLFIFAGEILGDIGNMFHRIPSWDLMMHTVTGFIMAAIGITLIDVLNKSPRINMSLSPFFVAFVAFCFSMTIGVLWEFTEYSIDSLFGSDMQKDTVVESFNTDAFSPEGKKVITRVSGIEKTVVYGVIDGEQGELEVENGYLDIGLHDTIEDLFVNLVGALVFSVIGALYIHRRGKGQVAEAFIPKLLTDEEAKQFQEQKEAAMWGDILKKSKTKETAEQPPSGGDVDDGKGS